MKIGFDAKRAFHNYTGLGNYGRTIIRNLALIYPEHEYFLYTPGVTDYFSDFPPPGVNIVEPQKKLHRFFKSYWRSLRMGRDIKTFKIDIFHGLSNELPQNIKRSGARSVVTIHDLIFMRFPHLYRKIDRLIYRNKFFTAGKMADRIIAISEQTKSDLISFYHFNPEKIEVIYQGCDPAFYHKVSDETKNQIRQIYKLPGEYILYVGTIEERKNLLQIIKARYEYRIDIPLVAIGRQTEYMDKIRKYMDEKEIKGIIFPGQVSLPDLPAIYQMSSVFIYPSAFEGFGIPVLEALNSGVPVITAKGSCLEETGGPHSIYINPSDPGEIATALQNLLSNRELRENMINEGYKHALNFREDKSIRKIMDLYHNLL